MTDVSQETMTAVGDAVAKAAVADPSRMFLAAVSVAAIGGYTFLGWKYLEALTALAQACGAQ